jgi:hypothetical protein
MVGRETVQFSQARNVLMLIEGGANIAREMRSIRVAEGIAAHELASKASRPQGE